MNIQLEVHMTEDTTDIFINHTAQISITNKKYQELNLSSCAIFFLVKDNNIVFIEQAGKNNDYKDIDFDTIISIEPQREEDSIYLKRAFIKEALDNHIPLKKDTTELNIPSNVKNVITEYKDKVLFVLSRFGYSLLQKEKDKQKPTKAQHRWSKTVSEIEFYINFHESKAVVVWQKRNEMVLKAGAKMMKDIPLNKDGSIGFGAKMGEKIRFDYKTKIKNFITTEDIIFKSVNEVGLFLYFGGTNSWLEMIDKDGKTIDEWTIVV
jgi:hypothetical protein